MNDPDDEIPLPAGVIAKKIGIYREWVQRRVVILGIQPESMRYKGQLVPCYPAGTITRLRAIRARIEYENSLPELMTAKQIAESLGCSDGWTRQTIKQHGISPAEWVMRKHWKTALYSKRVYFQLRRLLEETPVAEHGYNLYQLVELTGLDREWIERRLKECGVEPMLKRSPLTGKRLWFYGDDALKVLRTTTRPPAGGTWLTAEAIEQALGKSANWTKSRLNQDRYADLAELRLDAQLVPRLHYPPRVLIELQGEIAESTTYPEAGDYLLVYAIARQVGRSTLWVRNRLKWLNEEGELRRDKKGRPKIHYPPGIVDRILNEAPADLRGVKRD